MTVAVVEDLRKAADHIEKVGLHQGAFFRDRYYPEESPCCSLGALRIVTGAQEDPQNDEAWHRVSQAADALFDNVIAPAGNMSVPEWNDKASQRKGRVVAGFRRAADAVEKAAA